jgi:NAD(P)-dependent dehydrogenase (short-subunit alcohol dehydrogenase family)
MAHAVQSAFAELGARVALCAPADAQGSGELEAASEAAVAGAVGEFGGAADMLVVDAASIFSAGGPETLAACLQVTWSVTRSAFNLAFQAGERGGRILYLAPAPGAGGHAEPARAGLENLSRTLSIEWSRHGVTAVTIAPGDGTTAGEVAALAAYLASPAGAYFSGCLLDLRGGAA